MVTFDAGQIAALVGAAADAIGFPAETEIRVNVVEASPLGRSRLEGIDPITLLVHGGAFENPTEPRTLFDRGVIDVAGRLLFRAKDRLDPAFGEPPSNDDLTLAHATAWDAYCLGRFSRLGYDVKKPRRQYHFRNRHGFTDVADAVFERLWNAESLTWADIEAACAETAAVTART
jgi:hypothetical protein